MISCGLNRKTNGAQYSAAPHLFLQKHETSLFRCLEEYRLSLPEEVQHLENILLIQRLVQFQLPDSAQ